MNEYDSTRWSTCSRATEGYDDHQRRRGRPHPLQHLLGAREGAGKVFSDLGRVKHLKEKRRDDRRRRLRGQPGRRRHHRARPLCDVVFGPQTCTACRRCCRRAAKRRPQVDISFPEIESSTTCPRQGRGRAAFVSIMEGCSKYCSYCVVPYTRGEEVSRPFDDVLTEVAGLADQGVMEINLLGRTSTPTAAGWATPARSPTSRCCSSTRRDPGIRRACASPPATPTSSAPAPHRGPTARSPAREPPAPAGARQRPHPDGHEARLHGAGVQEHRPQLRAIRPDLAWPATSSSASRRDRRRPRQADEARRRTSASTKASASSSAPPRHTGGGHWKTPRPTRPRSAPAGAASRRRGHTGVHQREDGRQQRPEQVLVTGTSAKDPNELTGRTECNRIVNFKGHPASSTDGADGNHHRLCALAARVRW